MVVGTGLATVTESVAVAVAITAVNGTEIVLAGDTTVTGHATVRHASHASHASLVEVTNSLSQRHFDKRGHLVGSYA